MSDLIEYFQNDRGKFRSVIWETGKCADRGYVSFCIDVWEPLTQTWYELAHSFCVTLEEAERRTSQLLSEVAVNKNGRWPLPF